MHGSQSLADARQGVENSCNSDPFTRRRMESAWFPNLLGKTPENEGAGIVLFKASLHSRQHRLKSRSSSLFPAAAAAPSVSSLAEAMTVSSPQFFNKISRHLTERTFPFDLVSNSWFLVNTCEALNLAHIDGYGALVAWDPS